MRTILIIGVLFVLIGGTLIDMAHLYVLGGCFLLLGVVLLAFAPVLMDFIKENDEQ